MTDTSISICSQILEYSMQPYIIFWSILVLVLGALAILSVLTGFDLDLDTDIELDGDISGDVSGEGFFEKICIFFNVGHIPVTLIIFSLILSNWFICLIVNNILNTSHNSALGFIIMAAVFVVSIPITKIITIPLKKIFGAMKEGDDQQNQIVGNICVTTTEVTDKHGQATIETSTAPIGLMVECQDDETIPKGSKAVVLEKNKLTNRYVITKFDDLDI